MSIAATKTNKMPDKIKVNGVILVDKPQGMTSQQVVSKVKKILNEKKNNLKNYNYDIKSIIKQIEDLFERSIKLFMSNIRGIEVRE